MSKTQTLLICIAVFTVATCFAKEITEFTASKATSHQQSDEAKWGEVAHQEKGTGAAHKRLIFGSKGPAHFTNNHASPVMYNKWRDSKIDINPFLSVINQAVKGANPQDSFIDQNIKEAYCKEFPGDAECY